MGQFADEVVHQGEPCEALIIAGRLLGGDPRGVVGHGRLTLLVRARFSARAGQPLMNASRSWLMTSALIVHMPCDNPGYTCRVARWRSLTDSSAEPLMGTTWSSSPCITSVGTSMAR